MNYTAKLSDEAIQDYDEAVAWYERQKTGLGFDFAVQMAETLALVEDSPSIFQPVEGNIRCAHLKQFPYKVFYVFELSHPEILVFAILHDKRHPDFWRKRSRRF